MKEKVENPVLRRIAESRGYNTLDDYMPRIFKSQHELQVSYGIFARLPAEHSKWIKNIMTNPRFRESVKEQIATILSSHVFNGQSYLEIRWLPQGPSFETDGINGCMVYVDRDGYGCHNIDNFEQAVVLFLALSVYLRTMYFALEQFENGTYASKEFPPLETSVMNPVAQKIALNHVKGCQMTYDQCIHKYTFICDLCSRNPKAFSILQQKDLDRIGDKWEPKGGLEGRKLCPVCGSNISGKECPYCQS